MSFAVFLAVLFFAPLAFGTTETWSAGAAELLAAVAILFRFLPFGHRQAAWHQVLGLRPLLLWAAWAWLQCIPLPFSWLQLLSPNTAAAWQPVFDLLPPDTCLPLTLNRQATLLENLRLSSYILFYILTVQLLASGRRLFAAVSSIAGLSLCIAVAAMLQRATAPDSLFWLRNLKSGFGSFGPWVYKNHYAGFMVMTYPLLLTLVALNRSGDAGKISLREKVLHFFSDARGSVMRLLFGFGVMVIVASVLLAQSRGGILSLCAALLLFFLLLALRQGKMPLLPLMVLFGGLLLAGSWFSWEALFSRFQYAIDPATGGLRDDRLLIWRDTLRIIADFPLTGTGFGTFQDIFPDYKTLADNLIYDHAHNDYLELFADGGLIGFALAACFVGIVLRNGWWQIFRRHDRLAVMTAIGALSGLGGLLCFSLTDFNLHNWANGLYFFFFCGLLTAAGHTQHHYSRAAETRTVQRLPRWMMFLAGILLLLAVLRLHGGALRAEGAYRWAESIAESTPNNATEQVERMAELLDQARSSSPWNGMYSYLLAKIRTQQRQHELALQLYLEAAKLQPLEEAFSEAAEKAKQRLEQEERRQ